MPNPVEERKLGGAAVAGRRGKNGVSSSGRRKNSRVALMEDNRKAGETTEVAAETLAQRTTRSSPQNTNTAQDQQRLNGASTGAASTPRRSWKETFRFQSPSNTTASNSMRDENFASANDMALRLQQGTDVLINRLFMHLSRLPEETSGEHEEEATIAGGNGSGGGMTLPATAVAWLSSQYFPSDFQHQSSNSNGHDCDDCWVCPTSWTSRELRDRLRLLQFLLPRVTHLRISNRQEWPPPLDDAEISTGMRTSFSSERIPTTRTGRAESSTPVTVTDNTNSRAMKPSRNQIGTVQHPRPASPPVELNCSLASVDSALTMDDATASITTSRTAFIRYIQILKHRPNLDLRLFPKLQALVLEDIPISWITRLPSLHTSLQVLKWRNTNTHISNKQKYFKSRTPSQLDIGNVNASFPLLTTIFGTTNVGDSNSKDPMSAANETTSTTIFSRLTHLDLSGLQLGSYDSKVEDMLARCAPQLKSLSLSNNELKTEHKAISGLSFTTYLQKLNLSHNQLTSLPHAHLYLGGQLRTLQLSFNKLSSVTGIDRLYALEDLSLDNNSLKDISDVAGICRLPQLQCLSVQENPFTTTYPLYSKQLWSWFQEYRNVAKPSEMLRLDGRMITTEQWNALILEQAPVLVTVSAHTWSKVRPSKRRRRRPARVATIKRDEALHSRGAHWKKGENHDTLRNKSKTISVSFSVQDVLRSLKLDGDDDYVNPVQTTLSTILKSEDICSSEEKEEQETSPESSIIDEVWTAQNQLLPLEPIESDGSIDYYISDAEDMTENQETTISATHEEVFPGQIREPLKSDVSNDTANSKKNEHCLKNNLQKLDVDPSKVNVTRNRIFDVTSADWDEVLKQAEGGFIPDGKPRMPTVALASLKDVGSSPFLDEASELLAQNLEAIDPRDSLPMIAKNSTKLIDGEENSAVMSSVGYRSNTLPDQIYPDDTSVPSSLGTNRDDFPTQANKFNLAEENSKYEGPSLWAKRNVLLNLKDYFELYVFHSPRMSTSTGDEASNEMLGSDEKGEDTDIQWRCIVEKYPKIQLHPEDQRWSELIRSSSSGVDGNDKLEDIFKERFVRVWSERVVPCGRSALRRLPPNRKHRLGFHGDRLYTSGSPDPYAESRKVYLCLSSSAFYVIACEDDVTRRDLEKKTKKRFPNPLPKDSRFEDARWPHAISKHSLQDLESVTIGFEFQRLTVTFSNLFSRKQDPYVYVILTCNKKATVKLLQDIQTLAKDARSQVDIMRLDSPIVKIENDSQHVLDSLQEVLAPNELGTVLHFQIVYQRWKHGEVRGMVRRVCVVSETKMFLMDEDYTADSHQALESASSGIDAQQRKKKFNDLSKTSYRRVDEAHLAQVTEVQAASADPKAITIIIKPPGRLARIHRWRLVCSDNEGAERLVDDVRKAMSLG